MSNSSRVLKKHEQVAVYELADNLNVGAIIKHNPSTNLR